MLSLLLLLLAPILVALGYALAIRSSPQVSAFESQERGLSRRAAFIPWGIAVFVALTSVSRGGGWSNLSTWFNYREWVLARWQMFDTLTFFEFVNIYNILPTTTAIAILWELRRGGSRLRQLVVVIGLCMPVFITDILIFQKKTLLLTFFLLAFTIFLFRLFSPASFSLQPRPLYSLV